MLFLPSPASPAALQNAAESLRVPERAFAIPEAVAVAAICPGTEICLLTASNVAPQSGTEVPPATAALDVAVVTKAGVCPDATANVAL